MNPDLVTSIRTAHNPIGMCTNAGNKKLTLIGDVNKFGQVWYDLILVVNIFGVANMIDKGHCIIYDLEISDTFNIFGKDKQQLIAQFTRTPEGLYAFRPPKAYVESVARQKNMLVPMRENNIVATVEENK